MNRLVRLSFSFFVVGLGVACGGNVTTPVGTTGSGAGASGAAGTGGTGGGATMGGTGGTGGSGGDAGTSSTGGTSSKGGSGGTGGTSSKGGSGGTGGTSSKGGSGGTGGTSSKGGSGGTGGTTGGTGGTGGASCGAAKPLPDPCDCVPQGPAGYYWDGSVCTGLVACCPKVENGELYPTEAACQADHASCGSCGPATLGLDPCDCDPGKKVYYWNGQSCESALVCCPEGGAKLYDSELACEAEHESCFQGVTCKTAGDCPPPPPCLPCGNGTGTCAGVTCEAGQCVFHPAGECAPSCQPECTNGCSYTDKLCGKGGGGGACLPTPKCAPTYEPVCGCDDKVYDNACIAASAGVDTSLLGNCAAPGGYFVCGDRFCAKGKQYCQRLASDIGGFADEHACVGIPAACDAPGGGGGPCSCFEKEPCGSICKPDAEGYITLTCPGG